RQKPKRHRLKKLPLQTLAKPQPKRHESIIELKRPAGAVGRLTPTITTCFAGRSALSSKTRDRGNG
ncbi:MAG: hypothetical protein CME01_09770, partial [Geminicoccus sp.]|nr:hypothetical protein [Geminicoccus sp.]